ncbi:hypothetical protein [Nocardioides sp. SYSU D00065]|uniref:hypothetical protein n=1 Tax=Nocardioides sp. SYSU D00065 TaxID=2817378 RepID=UPI001B334126|nr:hypothetical protein [Nocardioides sp. SYSU D00065]
MRASSRFVALLSSTALALVLATASASADPAGHAEPAVPGIQPRGTVTSSAPYLLPVEDYAGYQPQTTCKPTPKRGVLMLADWLVARGGGYGPISRACAGSSTSEHKESRAFDWLLDARDPADAALAATLLEEVLAPDDTGAPHALARRMGIMYIIWDDRMYASYDGFAAKRYLSSSCRTKRTCSPTLRHRDHMHISLSRRGARGATSWYAAQPAS